MAALSSSPVIGYTLELEDPMLPHVEPALREPLERFGALAVVLPRSTPADRVDALLDLVDGVLLSGGADVHPRHYDEEVHELTRPIAEPHDEFEIALARAALDRGTPVLGICRGIQVMAVADGGRLTQDVETLHDGAHRHRFRWVDAALDPPGDHWHEVECVPGSRGRALARGRPAARELVPPPVGRRDRTAAGGHGPGPRRRIEAIERVDGEGFAAGMQWHDEMQWRHDERFLRPFQDLVEAAAERRHRA